MKQPPDLPRRFRMYPKQAIGLLVIATLPMLALMGSFDPKRSHLNMESASIRAELEYPEKVPYSTNSTMLLKITNISQAMLDSIDIDIDTSYLTAFDQISVTPTAERAFGVILHDIPAGEKREIRVDMMGREVGTSKGAILVRRLGEEIRLPISTTVFW